MGFNLDLVIYIFGCLFFIFFEIIVIFLNFYFSGFFCYVDNSVRELIVLMVYNMCRIRLFYVFILIRENEIKL